MKNMKSSQTGFTLLEIIVVITIIAIMAAYIAPNVVSKVDTAKITKVKNDVIALESSIELYKLDNFSFPSNDEGLEALVTQPPSAKNWSKGGYIKRLRKDPWGNDYQYRYPGTHKEFDIFSFGADGQEGGSGENQDLGNWES